jgi:hypothetical protein
MADGDTGTRSGRRGCLASRPPGANHGRAGSPHRLLMSVFPYALTRCPYCEGDQEGRGSTNCQGGPKTSELAFVPPLLCTSGCPVNIWIKMGAALALTISASLAYATCRWTWDCTGGQCRQVPICDSSIDLPPPRPPSVPPVAPPTVPPVPTPTVPPVGTGYCSPQYLCDGMGRCSWQTVCR